MKSDLSDWKVIDGLLFYKDRCYIPEGNGIRHMIVKEFHESPTTGHPGRDTTLELVQRHYWWPRLRHFIYEYVAGCATCQQNKVNTHLTQPPVQPINQQQQNLFR